MQEFRHAFRCDGVASALTSNVSRPIHKRTISACIRLAGAGSRGLSLRLSLTSLCRRGSVSFTTASRGTASRAILWRVSSGPSASAKTAAGYANHGGVALFRPTVTRVSGSAMIHAAL